MQNDNRLADVRAMQRTLLRTSGGRLLLLEMRRIGRIDQALETEEHRIAHNVVMEILTVAGANIQIGREQIPDPIEYDTEQDAILGVNDG